MPSLDELYLSLFDPYVSSTLSLIWTIYWILAGRNARRLKDRAIAATMMMEERYRSIKKERDDAENRVTVERTNLSRMQTNLTEVVAELQRIERTTEDIRTLQAQFPHGLRDMIMNAAEIVERRNDITRLRVQCSMNMPFLAGEALSAYLDGLEATIAVVPGHRAERPLEVAMRHKDGWVILHDGFHDFNLIGGYIQGVAAATIVPQHEGPIHIRRPRLGSVNRQMIP